MKKSIYLVLTFIFFHQFFSAQNAPSSGEINNKYIVVSGNDLIDEFFIESFEMADWDKYRYEDARRPLSFKNGVTIELLSAIELKKLGISYDQSTIIPKGIRSKSGSKFSINKDGHVIELHNYYIKK